MTSTSGNGSSTTGSSTGEDVGTAATTSTIKLDVPIVPDVGVGELNCERIDFLFVIDNSSSMQQEQASLAAAVPSFVETIGTALPAISDIRVGVVDTDSYPALGSTDPLDGCPDTGEVDCQSCDFRLGALLSKPLSAVDPNLSCDFDTGQPWMDADSAAFGDQFACAAIVGTEGNQVEQQAGALTEAISPELLGPGGCNEGFLRDDALLVVLIITDEEDDHTEPPPPRGGSLGEPDAWYQAVVDAKGGLESNAVLLALIGGSPLSPDCPELGADNMGAEPSPRLQSFVEMFGVHFVGSVCAASYNAFFDETLNTVAQGCSVFNPP